LVWERGLEIRCLVLPEPALFSNPFFAFFLFSRIFAAKPPGSGYVAIHLLFSLR
jgi:hypothetical protein